MPTNTLSLPPGPTVPPGRLLLTTREAATALAISERTLWTLTDNGELPSVKIGRLVRYRPEALAAFCAARALATR